LPFVDLPGAPSGRRIRYRQGGSAGPPVLFLHGAGASSAVWLSTLRRVAPVRRAVAFDFPGHGRSSGSASRFEDFLGATGELAAALCLGPSILVGHSLGGLVAQAAALAFPDKVAGLCLVTTAPRLAVSSRLLARIADDWAHWPELMEKLSYSADTPADVRRRSAGLAFSADQDQTLADFQACTGFDAGPRLSEISCPTLVVAGRHDQMVPRPHTAALADGIPGARLLELAAGHFPMDEDADAFVAGLLDLVARVARVGPAPDRRSS
jgi:pimeloyl-ACP methyl ester carboxylesterase